MNSLSKILLGITLAFFIGVVFLFIQSSKLKDQINSCLDKRSKIIDSLNLVIEKRGVKIEILTKEKDRVRKQIDSLKAIDPKIVIKYVDRIKDLGSLSADDRNDLLSRRLNETE